MINCQFEGSQEVRPLLYYSSLITSNKAARKVKAGIWWSFEEACKSGGNEETTILIRKRGNEYFNKKTNN